MLRFNDTRQSVSRVALQPDSNFPQAKAECLAFEYLKTMASAGLAWPQLCCLNAVLNAVPSAEMLWAWAQFAKVARLRTAI